jgi:hypothetical protein
MTCLATEGAPLLADLRVRPCYFGRLDEARRSSDGGQSEAVYLKDRLTVA